MIPPYPPEPRYEDAWKDLKATMHEAYIYEQMGEEEK